MKISEHFTTLTEEGRAHFYTSIYTTLRNTQKMTDREKMVALQVLRVVGMGIQELPENVKDAFERPMTDEQKALDAALFVENTMLSGLMCQMYVESSKHLDPDEDEEDEDELTAMLKEALRNAGEPRED